MPCDQQDLSLWRTILGGSSVKEDEMQKRSIDTLTILLVVAVVLTVIPALADESLDPAKRRMEQI
jgi:hypothetical protein